MDDIIDERVLEKFKEYMKLQQRNDNIVVLREEGWTLQKIGDKYGLSRERIRQILLSERNKNETA
jgi:DNA-directed RNA polymerase sigma subunit (sigma70/sigma32)